MWSVSCPGGQTFPSWYPWNICITLCESLNFQDHQKEQHVTKVSQYCCQITCDIQWCFTWDWWSIEWTCTSWLHASNNIVKHWPMEEHELLPTIARFKVVIIHCDGKLYKCCNALDLCNGKDLPFSWFNHWFMPWRGGVYGNCWIMAWTSDSSPEASTKSAVGAQVKAIHLCDQKGWNMAAAILDPI